MQLNSQISIERFPREANSVETPPPLNDVQRETSILNQLQAGDTNVLFQIGQFYFSQGKYDEAKHYFELAVSTNEDVQAVFQLGVMYYDGIGCKPDPKTAVEYMLKIATSDQLQAQHLIRAAQFNIGVAYHLGCGVRHSEEEAERYWLLAADDGNPLASVRAQSTLGLFYSSPDSLDLKKAFYWHTEACGNGSLESQGVLGVMYGEGLGVKRSEESALVCLKDAARRGNVYAMGHLIGHYYRRKLFAKSLELAARVSMFDDTAKIARETDCTELYIKKGISMACFYYALCLKNGRGTQVDETRARNFFSRSFQFDPDTCAWMQKMVLICEI